MWILRAVGHVHGQENFSFALKQKQSYSVGRGKECQIRFEDARVKPLQGHIVVDTWDPTSPATQPKLRWKSEPSKKGVFPAFKTILPSDLDSQQSDDLSEYDQEEIPEGTQGVFLHENLGQGIVLSESSWFTVHWESIDLCYDKFKDESEGTMQLLRDYCIPWTQSFDAATPPSLVLSLTFKNTTECNLAVCYGVQIVTPAYLLALTQKLNACWKLVADHQDSFSIPSADLPNFQPTLDPSLPKSRALIDCWLPDQKRRTLFAGWKILGLRSKVAPSEKRYLLAMGADYTEIDAVIPPLLTARDFADRIKDWLKTLNGSQGIVVYFLKVKEELAKAGGDFDSVIASTCKALKLYLASGAICWGAVRVGGVLEYIESVSGQKIPQPVTNPVAMAPPDLPTPMPSQAAPPSSFATDRPDFIPSTFPQETEGAGPNSTQPTSWIATTRTEPEAPIKPAQTPAESASSGESQGTRQVKKPLRKRAAGAAARKVDLFADLSMDSGVPDVPMPSQPPASQPRINLESQPVLTQPTQASGAKGRLKRRAGVETQASQFDFDVDQSYYAEQEKAEKEREIRKLYEETKAESAIGLPGPSKKRRIGSRAPSAESDVVSIEAPATQRATGRTTELIDRIMENDGGDDDDDVTMMEDPLQKTLRLAREAKAQAQQNVSASTNENHTAGPSRTRRTHVPSEEPEEVEDRTIRASSIGVPKTEPSPQKLKTGTKAFKSTTTTSKKSHDDFQAQNAPTKDEKFLTAIATASRSKAPVDELDREFNNLRIPKPSKAKPSLAPQALNSTTDHPDWNLVDQFDDDLRGNFIQIVKVDLFRKDGGKIKETRVDDGRPNFKKFKKKNVIRREPMQLVLAAPTTEDAEMGEAYWPTQHSKATKRVFASQIPSTVPDDEAEMPLLPRQRKKRLLSVAEDDDDEDSGPSGSLATVSGTSRRRAAATSTKRDGGVMTTTQPARRTRATSTVSEVSSVAPPTRGARSTVETSTSRPKGRKNAPMDVDVQEIQDSEDEIALDLGKTPNTTHSSRRGGTRGATSTLEGVDMPPPSRSSRTPQFDTGTTTNPSRASRSTVSAAGVATQSKVGTATPGTARASGRAVRRLLVDDDEEDGAEQTTLRGLTKKRRL
ncbi:hypothetical protein BD324DRAFT_613998 [Kockovaella imperatae]|uniref:Uncharacterized protein n=1 Tax=Kockovaella imperatae TaxID=4999 RepID=A0A1Y1UTK4_9TREE|nr:hypothetical protein BD324DRAFT_613998 [Kockovaella imperatae]ORX41292.1 hypothetical protein BD324DRAFT_613998 [Kockovaella imperatae]